MPDQPAFSPDRLEDLIAQALSEEKAQPKLSAPAQDKGIGIWPYLSSVAGPVADGITTLGAFNRGAHESNSLIGTSPGKVMAVKAGEAVLTPLVMKFLSRYGNGGKTAAKAIGYGSGALGGILAAHNSQVGR